MNWTNLTNVQDLEKAIEYSHQEPIVIFKHSTRCSVSLMAKRHFEMGWEEDRGVKPYFLDLLKYRPVSNQIAKDLNIHHESPQVIVVKNGIAIYDASHSAIQAEDVLMQAV